MTDQPSVDLASLVATLLQQQSATLQLQTALLEVHSESMRLQRLLVERLLGNASSADITAGEPPSELPASTGSAAFHGSLLPTQEAETTAPEDAQPIVPVASTESNSGPVSAPPAALPSASPPVEAESGADDVGKGIARRSRNQR
jgi:hypothetical protein